MEDQRQSISSSSRRSVSSGTEEGVSDGALSDHDEATSKLLIETRAPEQKRVREQVKTACARCKKRKGKCTGERPHCAYCKKRKISCQYEVGVGASRRAELERKLQEATSKSTELGIMLHSLKSGSDEQSTMLLARLRMGESVDEIVQSLLQPDSNFFCTRSGTTNSHRSTEPPRWPYPDGTNIKLTLPDARRINAAHQKRLSDKNLKDTEPQTPGSFVPPLFDRKGWEMSDPSRVKESQDMLILSSRPVRSMSLSFAADSSQREGSKGALTMSGVRQALPSVDASVGNMFGNLPFSSAIRANHYPKSIQTDQLNNLTVPAWAMRLVNSTWDGSGNNNRSLVTFLEEQRERIVNGVSPEAIFGKHPYIGALVERSTYMRAPPLSIWAARLIRSLQQNDPDITQVVCMYIFWLTMRWIIYPSLETYEALPEFLKPLPNQLFYPHPLLVDFMPWPEVRELCTKNPDIYMDASWMTVMAETTECDVGGDSTQFFCKNSETGEADLAPAARNAVYSLEGWSVGPAMRKCLNYADAYLRIR